MADDFRQRTVRVNQTPGELSWMGGGIPNALDSGNLVNIFEQQREIGDFRFLLIIEDPPIRVHILSKQSHFLDSLSSQPGDFLQNIGERTRNFLASGIGNNTKTAILAAPLHDRDEGRRPFDACGWQVVEFLDFREGNVYLGT